MTARLPIVGGDDNSWGDVLNAYLAVSHQSTGKLNAEGTGEQVTLYNATTASLLNMAIGTTASPDATLGSALKVQRVIQQTAAALGGDGVEQMASVVGSGRGTASNVGQVVGVLGSAQNAATNGVSQSGGGDACGIYGVGRVTGSGTGTGLNFLSGRRDTDTGRANALELSCQNYTPTAGSYSSIGFSDTTGLWIEAAGDSDSGVGISFGNPFSHKYDVGIGFTSQNGGPITSQSIRDDGASATSVLINGTHATAALAVKSGSGGVWIGGTSQVQSPSLLEVQGPNSDTDPLVVIGSVANTKAYSLRIRNAAGQGVLGISAGADNFLTGTISGDMAFAATTLGKSFHMGGTSSVFQVTHSNTLGFFQATPVAKQTVTGSRGANAALASLLTALASFGLITDSST